MFTAKKRSVAGCIGMAAIVMTAFAACMNSEDYKKDANGNRLEKAPADNNENGSAVNNDNAAENKTADNNATANSNTTANNTATHKRKMRMSVDMNADKNVEKKMAVDASGVYLYPDRMPQYPGGNEALVEYVENNTNYRESAINNETEGTVRVSFIVDEKGKVTSPTVVGNKVGSGLDEEAINVVKSMPDWQPGTVKGKKVKTRLSLPITFKLEEM
ncbi:MAG: energy transducer TonB [Chitinophagaceae bacterium]